MAPTSRNSSTTMPSWPQLRPSEHIANITAAWPDATTALQTSLYAPRLPPARPVLNNWLRYPRAPITNYDQHLLSGLDVYASLTKNIPGQARRWLESAVQQRCSVNKLVRDKLPHLQACDVLTAIQYIEKQIEINGIVDDLIPADIANWTGPTTASTRTVRFEEEEEIAKLDIEPRSRPANGGKKTKNAMANWAKPRGRRSKAGKVASGRVKKVASRKK